MAASNDAIASWLTTNAGASDTQIRDAMNQYGVSAEQMASATGLNTKDVQSRYDSTYLMPSGMGGAMVDSRTPSTGSPGGGMDNPAPYPNLTPTPTTAPAYVAPTAAKVPKPATAPAYVAPKVSSANSPGQIADLYRDYITKNGGDTVSNRNAAIDYLRGSGLSDSDIGQAYQSFLSTQPASSTTTTTARTGSSSAPSLGFNLNSIAGPTNWNVGGDQLVQTQLAKIMAGDSPLMQQARTRALQAMNERGTLNSSMATSAADSAMYDAALPIAQADAGTNASAASANTGYANAFAQDANAFTRSGVMADFNLGANEWAAQQQHARDLEIARINSENSKTSSATQFDQQNRQGYINGINQARTDWAEKFAAINSNNDLSPEVRSATLKSLSATYNTQIKQYAGFLDWDYNSWDIEYVDDTPP